MADSFQATWTLMQHDLPVITATMLPKVDAVVTKAALDVEAQAKAKAPVDTGTLRNSIQARRTGPAAWVVSVGADYGVYVEWGTSRAAAQPFLRPAITAVQPVFVAAMRRVMFP